MRNHGSPDFAGNLGLWHVGKFLRHNAPADAWNFTGLSNYNSVRVGGYKAANLRGGTRQFDGNEIVAEIRTIVPQVVLRLVFHKIHFELLGIARNEPAAIRAALG
jgi:hypothetical protein